MTFYKNKLKNIQRTVYSNDKQINTIISVRNYIDDNFDSDLNLDLLACTHFISKYHLLRLFKKYYGQTPKQYIIDKRLEKSKEFLSDMNSISHTCYAVGFESLSSFSNLFKLKTGKTPSDFQKEQLSRS